nr:hypothetical protein [Candidatus Njordarchaeum guaymaensis]
MSIAIQDLPGVLKIIVLLNLDKEEVVETTRLKRMLDRVCADHVCLETGEFNKALNEMVSEGLISSRDGAVQLTDQGANLSNDWRGLLLKREPILEVVAGLTDGSITGLVVILSAFIAGLPSNIAVFAAFLTLSSVAITNFSSFLLGGITEDISDMITLQNLVRHSLKGITDKKKRDRSLLLVSELFTLLHSQLSRANLYAATLCSVTTFLAGFIPISVYLVLPSPLHIILSLGIVGAVVGGFLVRYRSRRTKVHWRVTLLETVVIILIAVAASLMLGGSI